MGESSGTLNGHRKFGLSLDHFEMNKFADNQDDHYLHVSNQIKDMVDGSRDIIESRLGGMISTNHMLFYSS